MDYKKLQSEIIGNPSLYGSMTDQQIADELNLADKVSTQEYRITALGMMKILGATNGAAYLDALTTVAAQNSAVKWAMGNILTTGIDVGDPEVVAMLNMLTGTGVLVASDTTKVLDAAKVSQSRAQQLGFRYISAQMVGTALGGNW